MKIYSYKDVAMGLISEEMVNATKTLGENFWYKKRKDKIEALNIWAKIFNREVGFNKPVKFATRELETEMEVEDALDTLFEEKNTVCIPKKGKVSLVTSIFQAMLVGLYLNTEVTGGNLVDATTGEVIEDDMYCEYLGFTARAYALNLYMTCFYEKYTNALDPEIKDIQLLLR